MKIMGREYKLPNILLIIFVVILFIWTIDLELDKELEIYQQELIRKESWLVSELDSIANFMNFKVSDYRYFNRKVWYTSRYVSPQYDKNELLRLYNYLIKKGWVDITSEIDRDEYISKTASQSEETAKYVHILCNKKATIFMYMTDMQNDYVIDLFKTRTLVELKYDYSLPCYDLN
ncbi:hypothetical protein [Psychrobacter jeotgali]|uniref:hypothetical protein n=1 Tax=Psychrobacter jeotgali TaxID=179010 RepID=UPI00191B6BBF|nr:hypothetical protein [Psychrobacter jeotgali]